MTHFVRHIEFVADYTAVAGYIAVVDCNLSDFGHMAHLMVGDGVGVGLPWVTSSQVVVGVVEVREACWLLWQLQGNCLLQRLGVGVRGG